MTLPGVAFLTASLTVTQPPLLPGTDFAQGSLLGAYRRSVRGSGACSRRRGYGGRPSRHGPSCPGDFNHDGQIGITDLLIFISVFEHTPGLFCHTKHLTNVILFDKILGFHITAPVACEGILCGEQEDVYQLACDFLGAASPKPFTLESESCWQR